MLGLKGFGNTGPAMQRRRLPIGIQSFRRLRERDCYYVDKTALIGDLIDRGEHYFLSRPRRFGKSLLLDTLGELFAGSEELFRGLRIHDRWDWDEKHPVLRLSFGGMYSEPGGLGSSIHTQLRIIERNAGLDPAPDAMTPPDRLRDLLDRLHQKTGRQVVVLVDEYDKPILDVLGDPERAGANRDQLRGFYGAIKDCAHLVRFVFVMAFKMAEGNEDAEAALDRAMRQIRARGYADRYRDRGEPIHLVGAVFGGKERNLLAVRSEPV